MRKIEKIDLPKRRRELSRKDNLEVNMPGYMIIDHFWAIEDKLNELIEAVNQEGENEDSIH